MESPDSVPSLSAISSVSDDFSPVQDVAKKLVFDTPKKFQSKWGDAIANIVIPPSPIESFVNEPSARSDFPLDDYPKITEQTMIETEVGKRLCIPAIEEPQGYSDPMSDLTHGMDVFGPAVTEGSEDRRIKTAAAELFTKFDLSEEDASSWPPRPMGKESVKFDTPPNEDDTSFVTKNTETKQVSADDLRSKYESMMMQVNALEEFIRFNSRHVMKLKRGLDHAKEAAHHHLSVIKLLSSKLRVSKRDHGNSVKAAQQHEIRARQDKESIEILKAEIHLLTKVVAKSATTKTPTDETEVQHLRYENDLFATHIIENENKIERLKMALETKESTLVNLALQMENMKKAAHVESLHDVESKRIAEVEMKRLKVALETKETEIVHLASAVENMSKATQVVNLQDIESKRLEEVLDIKSTLDNLTLNLDRAVADSRTELKTKDRQIRELKMLVEIVMARQNEQGSEKIHPRVPETSMIVKHIVSMDREVEVLVKTLHCRDTEILELKRYVMEAKDLSSPTASSKGTASTADSTPRKRFQSWFGH